MQKNDVYKTGIFKKDEEILRVLKIKEGKALVVDCVKSKMPWWISPSDLSGAVEISEDDLLEETGMYLPEDISAVANRVMHKRFHMIAGILPFVDDKKKRIFLIEEAVRMYGVSINTVKNYLISYLVYQNILVLAPKEKTAEKKELTQDEKNMRWALNKYYYTQKKQSISTAYTQMVKEKYCDREGRLQGHYPSIHQFRYFYRKNRKMQTYYISRNGLKDYQRNYRPLVGDGVQEEYAAVGVGMLDSTICDIYLVDDSGNLVGRPILVACVDAYSSFCYDVEFEGDEGFEFPIVAKFFEYGGVDKEKRYNRFKNEIIALNALKGIEGIMEVIDKQCPHVVPQTKDEASVFIDDGGVDGTLESS